MNSHVDRVKGYDIWGIGFSIGLDEITRKVALHYVGFTEAKPAPDCVTDRMQMCQIREYIPGGESNARWSCDDPSAQAVRPR